MPPIDSGLTLSRQNACDMMLRTSISQFGKRLAAAHHVIAHVSWPPQKCRPDWPSPSSCIRRSDCGSIGAAACREGTRSPALRALVNESLWPLYPVRITSLRNRRISVTPPVWMFAGPHGAPVPSTAGTSLRIGVAAPRRRSGLVVAVLGQQVGPVFGGLPIARIARQLVSGDHSRTGASRRDRVG